MVTYRKISDQMILLSRLKFRLPNIYATCERAGQP